MSQSLVSTSDKTVAEGVARRHGIWAVGAMSKRKATFLGPGFLAAWMLFFAIWLAATSSLQPAVGLTGLFLSAIVARTLAVRTTFWAGLRIGPFRVIAGLRFLAMFTREMLSSNVAVLGYVYAPRVATSPRVIEAPIRIKGRRERLVLTNALALTPGTLPIDLDGERLDVHLLDSGLEKGARDSVSRFEKLLEKAIG